MFVHGVFIRLRFCVKRFTVDTARTNQVEGMDGMDGFKTPPNEIDEEWLASLCHAPRRPDRPQYFNATRPTNTTEDTQDHFGPPEDHITN